MRMWTSGSVTRRASVAVAVGGLGIAEDADGGLSDLDVDAGVEGDLAHRSGDPLVGASTSEQLVRGSDPVLWRTCVVLELRELRRLIDRVGRLAPASRAVRCLPRGGRGTMRSEWRPSS